MAERTKRSTTKRSTKRPTRSPKKDLEALETGTLEQMIKHFGSEEAVHRAYEQLVDELPRRPAERPAAWWLFEGVVPDELRQRGDEDEEELRRRRRAWLGDQFGE